MSGMQRWRETVVSVGTLFLSTGTLLCCALPILLVSLGMGAVVASVVGSAPWLVELSRHKIWLFATTGVLLLIDGWLIYRSGRQCPTDPVLAKACATADRWNRRFWWVALSVWSAGTFMAYAWLPVMQLMATK